MKRPPKNSMIEKNGWHICKNCGDIFVMLFDNGNCVECDYKLKHPDAQKKYCSKCIHFRRHNLYDKNDHSECCCMLHLEGKHDDEWSYLCRDYIDADILGYKINEKLIQYAPSGRTSVPCEDCRQKSRFLFNGLCLPCYEKKLEKAKKSSVASKLKAGKKFLNANEKTLYPETVGSTNETWTRLSPTRNTILYNRYQNNLNGFVASRF